MPRIRSLKYEYFINEDLAQISLQARFLGLGLTTIADREGRLEDRPLRIKVLLFPYHDIDVDKALDELEAARFLQRYAVADKRYIAVINFLKHQRPHPREADSTIPGPEKASPRRSKARPNREKETKADAEETPCQTQPGGLGDLGLGDSGSSVKGNGTPVNRKPSAHAELLKFLESKIGPIPNTGKQGKAIKWLLDHGYDVMQIKACYEDLAAESWRTTTVDFATVQSQIGAWLIRHPPKPAPRVPVKTGPLPPGVASWTCECGFAVLQNGNGIKQCPECQSVLKVGNGVSSIAS